MNIINYDDKFEEICCALSKENKRPKLLLHACCAPCSTYCLTRVLPFFDVTLYYFNDNIAPETEWEKRLGELTKLTDIVNAGEFVTSTVNPIRLLTENYNHSAFTETTYNLENEKEGGIRCQKCFAMRLCGTALKAKELRFDYFGTTLSVSPYKNSAMVNTAGSEAAEKYGVDFMFADFKKRGGYNESVKLSALYKLYRQHYCGCTPI